MRTTIGIVVAEIWPSSGIVIWKSESSSSSIASNSWSVLSISSISSTTGSGLAIACISGRVEQELLAEDVVLDVLPAGLAAGLDPQQLLAVVPLVQRLRLVEALVALQAHQLAAGGARERLRQLGLADPRRALDQDRLAEPLGEEGDQRRGLVGEVADLRQRLLHLRDGAIGHGGDDNPAPVPDLVLPLAALLPHSPGPYIALMLVGFAIGILGHLTARAGWSPPASILIFLGALLFPLAAQPDRPSTAAADRRIAAATRPTSLTIRLRPVPDPEEPHPLSRLRIFVLFAALAALATVVRRLRRRRRQQRRRPADGARRRHPRRGRKRRPRPLARVKSSGDEGGDVDVSLSGPFQGDGNEELPNST